MKCHADEDEDFVADLEDCDADDDVDDVGGYVHAQARHANSQTRANFILARVLPTRHARASGGHPGGRIQVGRVPYVEVDLAHIRAEPVLSRSEARLTKPILCPLGQAGRTVRGLLERSSVR